jgi:hypothetical protein
MPEEKKDKQDRMIELLEEMLRWMKVTSIPQVKKLLLDTLPSDKEKIAYHYSDGRDSRAVSTVAGVHFTTIARWWRTWTRVGIAESVRAKGGDRARRSFLLEDFGIEVPERKEMRRGESQRNTKEEESSKEAFQEATSSDAAAMEDKKTGEPT